MAIDPVYAGMGSSWIPSMTATRGLTTGYTRKPEEFKINTWAQIIKVDTPIGLYRVMTNRECIRVLGDSINSAVWAPGTVAPETSLSDESWSHDKYDTKRVIYPFVIDDREAKAADLDILLLSSRISATRAMTARSNEAIKELGNTDRYEASHIIDVTTDTHIGGSWSQACSATPYIMQSLNYAQEMILRDTLGVVTAKDLQLIISPTLARNISQSQELVDYMKGSPFSADHIRGTQSGFSGQFRIPNELYGIKVIVEDTVKVTTPKGQASSPVFAMPEDEAYLCARPGSIEGGAPKSPNFSSIVFFMKEEMSAESFAEPQNRRTMGRIVEDWSCRLIAPSAPAPPTSPASSAWTPRSLPTARSRRRGFFRCAPANSGCMTIS